MAKQLWAIVLMTALIPSARAQLRLGLPVTLPQVVPLQGLAQTVSPVGTASLGQLSDLRHLLIKRLVRANRAVLDMDPHGEPIVRGEILALSPSEETIERARALGFLVDRERSLEIAPLRVSVFKSTPDISATQALKVLREADPVGIYDYNHIYTNSGGHFEGPGTPQSAARAATAQTGAPPPSANPPANALPPIASQSPASPVAPPPSSRVAPAASAIRVGLVDTGIDVSHPIFRNATVHAWGCEKPIPDAHGTAVASLLLTHAPIELYAADVYCGKPTGGAVDAIVAALAWMASERVPVINMSLVGPKNALLEHAVSALLAGGYIIVAAVGNDGPNAPPLYPAAYANVVGVTGVDAARRVLIEAVRGPQVMFAARGADVKAATTEHSFAVVRGTSFAAPVVAELLAERIASPDRVMAQSAVDALAREAIDLGAPGRDLTYGFGLVGAMSP